MPHPSEWLDTRAFLLFLAILVSLPAHSTLLGAQKRSLERSFVVSGSVRDADGVPIIGAEVRLIAGRDSAIRRTTSDGAGRFRITARPLAGAHATADPKDYELVVRRLGYRPERRAIRIAAGDSLHVSLTLRELTVRLDPLEVEARAAVDPAYIIGADTIARRLPYPDRNAWDVIVRLRPSMGGGVRTCDRVKHVWINGIRESLGRTAKEVLAEIRAEHVEEMRYVDCWDTKMPGLAGHDAVYVVLKVGVRYRAFHGTGLIVPDGAGR